MFDVSDELSFKAKVTIEVPGKSKAEVEAEFTVIGQDEFEELSQKGDRSLLERVVKSVSGLKRNGQPLEGDEAKNVALNHFLLSAGLAGVYLEARGRNFRQGKSR